MPIVLPPLRERISDVLELADHFLAQASERLERTPFALDADARALLTHYDWPGNVRELQNVLTRACVINQDETIQGDLLRPWLAREIEQRPSATSAGMTLDEIERRTIVATLERFGGHRGKTAEALGIGVRTLSGKLRSYGYAPREKDFAKAS